MAPLPLLRHEQLDEDGTKVWDAVVSTRGTRTIHEEGYLTGPFNTLLHAPGVGLKVAELGAALRYHSVLPQDLLEVAVITIAARWHAEYEWYMHANLARAQNVPEAVITAIRDEETPPFTEDHQRIVHQVAYELARSGRLEPATYAGAHAFLGDNGMVELVTLCGYYSLMSFGLNVFDVPLPDGESPQWG